MEHLGKEPSIFITKERNDTFKFEQKPLEIDNSNTVEEEEVNEKIKKRKKDVKQLKKQIAKTKKTKNEEKLKRKNYGVD